MAACPVHEERTPSMHVTWRRGQRGGVVLLYCHGCQAQGEQIAQALGLQMGDLFDEPLPQRERGSGRVGKRSSGGQGEPRRGKLGPLPALLTRTATTVDDSAHQWVEIERYPYSDRHGRLVQEVIRQECTAPGSPTHSGERHKQFRQRYLTGDGHWVSRRPPRFRPVLYRAAQVAATVRAGEEVWLLEGEKDVHTAEALGVVATTNTQGGKSFPGELVEELTGARVIVVLDRDATGWARGVDLHAKLTAAGATVLLRLPALERDKADLTDHVQAGHGLGDLVDVRVEEVATWHALSAVRDEFKRVQLAVDEAKARWERAEGGQDVQENRRCAQRWVAETHVRAQALRELTDKVWAQGMRVGTEWAGEAMEAADRLLTEGTDLARSACADLEDRVAAQLDPQLGQEQGLGETVAEHPAAGRLPDPQFVIPMSRGLWRYELGGPDRRPRGVYVGQEQGWRLVAPFPHVQARIVRRDGTGRRVGTDYLLSAQPDSPATVITDDGLGRGRWANELGLALSDDDKIQRAVSTAIRCHGEHVAEREATARVEGGRVSIPCPQTLPPGYLVTGDTTREEGLAAWADILTHAARSPNLALLLGAAAVAPFVAVLGRQSHIMAIYGDSDRGKTVAMRTAAAIWGNSVDPGGVLKPWNATLTAVPRYLGALGVLPPLIDELGQAGAATRQQWGKLIYDVAEGGQRMVSEMRGPGVRVGMPWHGVMISAGNGRMTDGLGAGRYAGVAKRVVELATPFTLDAEHAAALQGGDARILLRRAYGHAGLELLERHSATTVAPIIGEVEHVLGLPDGGNHRTVARHLHAHVAGAAMLDDIAGTGTLLYEAALAAARTYMSEWAEPEHDADRIITELRDMLAREPAMWPTVTSYRDHKRVKTFEAGDTIPAHGVNRTVCGLQDDDGQWVAVFSRAWRDLCTDLDVDSTVACRELHARGVLHTTESRRRHGEWTRMVREAGTGMYYLTLPAPQDDIEDDVTSPVPPPSAPSTEPPATDGEDAPPPALGDGDVVGDVVGRCGSVVGGVVGPDRALTSGVVGVVGKTASKLRAPARARAREEVPMSTVIQHLPPGRTRPCGICRTAAWDLVDGQPCHLGECRVQLLERRGDTSARAAPTPGAPTLAAPAPASTQLTGTPVASPVRPPHAPPRFTAPAAVLDAQHAYLPGGESHPWAAAHLGELALLAAREGLRLGWGGGPDRLPDLGQIWVATPEAMARLGLPPSMDVFGDQVLSKSDRRAAAAKAFDTLAALPVVTTALEQGWQLGQGGRLDAWTRVWHPDLLPSGAWLVFLPWQRLDEVALLAPEEGQDQVHPAVLADRLAQFAQAVGVSWRLSSAATGLDLIDHTRPPRRSVDDDRGANRRRVALVRGVEAELPPFLRASTDHRFARLESDFSWWRPWTKLLPGEKKLPFVVAFDRNASYLSPWTSIELGVAGLTHTTGEAAAWDGSEKPGYYLVNTWDWDCWWLPDPGQAAGAPVCKDLVWVTVHTLRQLRAAGITPVVHEAYRWATTSRYLETAGTTMKTARENLPKGPVLDTVKSVYTTTVGKLAEREHRADFHLHRPDWRHHIIAATRTAILHTLRQIHDAAGAMPLVVDRDLIVYASPTPDPAQFWPERLRGKLGGAIGGWKPAGVADLPEWGPQFLRRRTKGAYFAYIDATQAMREPGS